jgi:hypothetical protein
LIYKIDRKTVRVISLDYHDKAYWIVDNIIMTKK